MDERLVATLVFLGGGGLLSALSLAMFVQAYRFRQTAVRTTGTVIETWAQPTKAQPLESVYKQDEDPPEAPTAKNVYGSRTRWIKVAYQDVYGELHEVKYPVQGRYTIGQQVILLAAAEKPTTFRIDSPLELYGKAAVIGVMAAVFLVGGGLISGGIMPLAGG